MQYVGRAIGSVSKKWSSFNPATLSGAIDVIVVEQPDGTLSCSPFHVRFGIFRILQPSQKKVEVIVNGKSTNIPMKLADSGEAYFVFETLSDINSIPSDMLASPISSATSSPDLKPINTTTTTTGNAIPSKQNTVEEPDYLDLSETDDDNNNVDEKDQQDKTKSFQTKLNKRLTDIHIPNKIDNNGDLLLDMEGYMPNSETMHDTDMQLKQLLVEELGNEMDISKFIREDANGGIRIVNPYEHLLSSASPQGRLSPQGSPHVSMSVPALVDDSMESTSPTNESLGSDIITDTEHHKEKVHLDTNLTTEEVESSEKSTLNYIKTLRLTNDQLRCLDLKYGENDLVYSIDGGRAVVTSKLYVWRWDVPIVISDIDGTITKSDALGHVLAMIGKDWTHQGVAKLFNEIARNGYNILYLTARSAGQSDATRSYLRSIDQDGTHLPHGPVILSPDRTMAALRREMILKKPEIFKIACLNDIRSLYFDKHDLEMLNRDSDEKLTPFFAGFGNRITDALSYRTVGIPSSRIFTINPEGDVHMELLELAGYKSSYLHINELVDHFFPPVSLNDIDRKSSNSGIPGSPLSKSVENFDSNISFDAKSLYRNNQGEKFSDVNFWREPLLDLDDLSDISSVDDNKIITSSKLNSTDAMNTKEDKKKPDTKPHLDNDTKTKSQAGSKDAIGDTGFDGAAMPDATASMTASGTGTIGEQIYLTLGSPLSSPTLTSIDTTNIDSEVKRLSISRPTLPTSKVSRVSVLDDVHVPHNKEDMEEESEFDDEDDDEFDEDEFID